MPLTGGTFTGPDLNGKLLPGSSADWQTVLPDGTALGDIRYTLRTDDGILLYVQSRGMRHGSADVLARLARGEDVDASEYTFRTSTKIETAAAGLEWLNKGVFISVGARQRGGVIYETYLVGTPGGFSPAIGSGISSSAASHLENCCRARYWLLAYAALYRSSSRTIHRWMSCLPTSSQLVRPVSRRRWAAANHCTASI